MLHGQKHHRACEQVEPLVGEPSCEHQYIVTILLPHHGRVGPGVILILGDLFYEDVPIDGCIS